MCGAEPMCGAEQAWGCGSAGSGELLGREEGLLSRNRVPKNGPIYAALDTVAGGIQRLVTHRCPARKSGQMNCPCSTCSHSMSTSGPIYSSHPSFPTVAPQAPHVRRSRAATQVETVPKATSPATSGPRTSIRDDAPKTLTTPPLPKPRPLHDGSSSRPGAVFDELTDPFQDDSASHTARQPQSILQAAFARSDASRSQSEQDADDYSEYFRD